MRRTALLAGILTLMAAGAAGAQESVVSFAPRLAPPQYIAGPAATAGATTHGEVTLRMHDDVSSRTGPTAAVRQAIEHSDAYYTRLTIHRYGSYAILPLFAGQYYLGSKLIDGTTDSWVKPTHRATAYAIAGVFASNTITGVWNAIESRHDKEGRGRRLLHGGLMLAADAGFAYTGLKLAGDASDLGEHAREHRNAALISVGLATTGTLIMWLR